MNLRARWLCNDFPFFFIVCLRSRFVYTQQWNNTLCIVNADCYFGLFARVRFVWRAFDSLSRSSPVLFLSMWWASSSLFSEYALMPSSIVH